MTPEQLWKMNGPKSGAQYKLALVSEEATHIAFINGDTYSREEIIRAVIAHEELIDAIKEALKAGENQGQAWKWAPILRQALARAEAK